MALRAVQCKACSSHSAAMLLLAAEQPWALWRVYSGMLAAVSIASNERITRQRYLPAAG